MYANYEYYSGTYGGTVPEPDILPRLRQAARDVDTLTFGRIHAVGLENLSAYQQEIIQECCCHWRSLPTRTPTCWKASCPAILSTGQV